MEELPGEIKIIVLVLCAVAIVLLATGGKLMEKLRGTSKPKKAK